MNYSAAEFDDLLYHFVWTKGWLRKEMYHFSHINHNNYCYYIYLFKFKCVHLSALILYIISHNIFDTISFSSFSFFNVIHLIYSIVLKLNRLIFLVTRCRLVFIFSAWQEVNMFMHILKKMLKNMPKRFAT